MHLSLITKDRYCKMISFCDQATSNILLFNLYIISKSTFAKFHECFILLKDAHYQSPHFTQPLFSS